MIIAILSLITLIMSGKTVNACLIEETRRLHNDDAPLFLSLAWSEEHEDGLDRKQFVLKEKHTDIIDVCYLLYLC